MSVKLALMLTFIGHVVISGIEGKSFFGVGNRNYHDHLLVKDVQPSRPGGADGNPEVVFKYEVIEPITYIQIESDHNLKADVKFSYVENIVVGSVSGLTKKPFDVTIMIYGFDMLSMDGNTYPLINRDQTFEGELLDEPILDESESDPDQDSERDTEQESESDSERDYDDTPNSSESESADFEVSDKVLDIGRRQAGDKLLYETYQTSPDVIELATNRSVVFYYIDSVFITYVKFVVFTQSNDPSDPDYIYPHGEYTHYSPGTLKAVITDYNTTSLFVQMFIYGYEGNEVLDVRSYEPFIPAPHWQPKITNSTKNDESMVLTPLQRLQLLLLTGKVTQGPIDSISDSDDDSGSENHTIDPKDMILYEVGATHNAALDQLDRRLWAFIGALILLWHY